VCPVPFAPKGAIPSSHGETVAGLDRLLKAGPPGRRRAAGRRPGSVDRAVQTGTLGLHEMKGGVGRDVGPQSTSRSLEALPPACASQ